MTIRITAQRVDNPRQGWSAWLARVSDGQGVPFFMGPPHASFCDAIDAAAGAQREMNPGARIAVADPTPAQHRKAARWESSPRN